MLNNLKSNDSIAVRFAIRNSYLNRINDDETVAQIKLLKTSKLVDCGISISDCAYAYLDLMNIEKYQGNNQNVRDYINTKFLTENL